MRKVVTKKKYFIYPENLKIPIDSHEKNRLLPQVFIFMKYIMREPNAVLRVRA
jgi:hypothetical protein